jgi:hypothetical protein
VTPSSQTNAAVLGTTVVAAVAFTAFIVTFVDAGNFRHDARLFPRLIAVCGAISALVILANACIELRKRQWIAARSDSPRLNEPGLQEKIVGYGGPAFYGLLLYLLGFWIASILCLAGLLIFLGERRPLLIAAITAGTLLSIYLVFEFSFSIRMPAGLLLSWLRS